MGESSSATATRKSGSVSGVGNAKGGESRGKSTAGSSGRSGNRVRLHPLVGATLQVFRYESNSWGDDQPVPGMVTFVHGESDGVWDVAATIFGPFGVSQERHLRVLGPMSDVPSGLGVYGVLSGDAEVE